MSNENLVLIIEQHRAKIGLSQAQFAKRVGISEATWSRIRRAEDLPVDDRRKLSLSVVRKIGTAFPELWPDLYKGIAN